MHYLLRKTMETTSIQSQIGGGKSWRKIADSYHARRLGLMMAVQWIRVGVKA